MKDSLESSIRKFANNQEIQLETLALMKVGREKGDTAEAIIDNIIANILLRFNGIPIKIDGQN